jgi:formylglycine-generating enzyme required for sulfatase activity
MKYTNTLSALLLCASLIFLPLSSFAEEVTVMLPGDVPMVMVKIPAGTFLMGSPGGERGNIFDNEDQHAVTLTQDYFLGKTEVTQQQWAAVMGTPMPTSCGTPAIGDNFPVYCVTWNDMAGTGGFVEKLNTLLETETFRLPTEAEWERAARSGTTTRFSHGDILQCGDDCEACAEHDPSMWFCGNNSADGPKPVGQLLANQFGLHDMHGNLFELVNDLYDPDYGSASGQPSTDPTGPAGNSNGDIVFRSGGATSEVWLARSAARLGGSPSQTNTQVGFRVAASSLEFQINPGLNDAWYDRDTDGQGFFITVLPDLGVVSLAWFTYDTELPPEDATANLGDPGHRWLLAVGSFTGNKAILQIEMTSGGIFDTPTDIDRTDPPGSDGSIILTFDSCNSGTVEYNITSINRQGIVPIQRVADDNIVICEAL